MPYVYMRFTFDKRWTCSFTNQFTQQRVRHGYASPTRRRFSELAQRGKALTDLSSKNNFEHAVRNGGGGVILETQRISIRQAESARTTGQERQ